MSWLRPATGIGSNWMEPNRRRKSSTASGPPCNERAGASSWRVTRKRRASWDVTFTAGRLPCVRKRLYSRERGTGCRRGRPRSARGGGPRERRTAERHHLRDRNGGRSAARGDIHSARRCRLVPLAARQREDGGRPRRERDVRPWVMDRVGDGDSLRRLDGAGVGRRALGGGQAASGAGEPLREAGSLSRQRRAGLGR